MSERDNTEAEPLFMISVAARLAGMHPQTLRQYERKELLKPSRTEGSTRLYSQADIARLKYIHELTQSRRINLAGVQMVFELLERVEIFEQEVDEMQRRMAEIRTEMEEELQIVRRSMKAELAVIPKGGTVVRIHRG